MTFITSDENGALTTATTDVVSLPALRTSTDQLFQDVLRSTCEDRRDLIVVTVDAFETRRKYEHPKTATLAQLQGSQPPGLSL